MKRSFVLFAIALLTLIGGAADAVAADNAPVLSRIVESGTFKVGMSGTQPPFSVISKSGALIGYEVDLANILADAMGVKVEFVQKPFGQLLPALEKGEIDAIMSGMTMTPKRDAGRPERSGGNRSLHHHDSRPQGIDQREVRPEYPREDDLCAGR
jgi:ABC-type amino acid transport substrate-binding protein